MNLIRSGSDLNKIIKSTRGDRAAIQVKVLETLDCSPVSLLQISSLERYLSFEERREVVRKIINNTQDIWWIRYTKKIRDYIPDEELREHVLKIYTASPWWFYTQAEALQDLFPNEYFKTLLWDNDDFEDLRMKKLFLLYNAHQAPEAFSGKLQDMLLSDVSGASLVDVDVIGYKEPWFACGGMERNYMEAMITGKGVCLVNWTLFAKFYHSKWEPAKVSFLPAKTYKAKNGFVLWKDYFYAPSNGQHELVMEAIQRWQKTLTIPDLHTKSVRPCIDVTSESILALADDEMKSEVVS